MLLALLPAFHITLSLEGLKYTSRKFVTEELCLEDFERASTQREVDSLVKDRQSQLLSTGVFIAVQGVGVIRDTHLLLAFQFVEMPPVIPYPVLDYSDQTGWTYGLMASFLNLWGSGHALAAGGTLGGQKGLYISYMKPATRGHRTLFKLKLGAGTESWKEPEINDVYQKAKLELGRAFVWPSVVSFGLAYERHGFADSGYTYNPDNTDHLLISSLKWQNNGLDNPSEPTHGVFTEISAYRAQEILSGGGFAGISVKAKAFATQARTTVATRAYVQIQSKETPFYKQYYMGGLYALRSYEYPTERTSSRVLLTCELRNRIFTWTAPFSIPVNFYATPFAEAGSTGSGDNFVGNYMWGYGFILGVFSVPTGFGSVDITYNQNSQWAWHGFVGWAF